MPLKLCPQCQNRLAEDYAGEQCPHCGSSLVSSPTDERAPSVTPGVDRRLSQTLDSVHFPTVDRASDSERQQGSGATVGSADFAESARLASNMSHSGAPASTDGGNVPTGDVKLVDNVWRGANVDKASPRMTIKGREPKITTTRTSLVIQPRLVREVRETLPEPSGDADYDILKRLGEGGMGVVYSARQASIDRDVAVKMLQPEMAKDEGQRNKFLAEAVITGDLDHPNIVPIYDLGKNKEGALFYAMKQVQGTPWDKVLDKKPLSENLEILLKVADAVAFAHNRSVVHRDLKPENVMLGDFGEVLVMDWGLALPFGNFAKSRSIQASTGLGGTPAYMAPEMATGPFDKIGPTSDVYLLGAILFEIVTGSPPHTGGDVMKCLFAAAKNDIQPTDKSGELMDIAMKAMATRPSDRYQTVQDFQAAVREYQSHSASIAMADRAEQALRRAQANGDYDTFAHAVFEFQESVTLWPDNQRGKTGIMRAKLAYALAALEKADLDLAESLLDANEPQHHEALSRVAEAKRDRVARQLRLKANRRLIRTLVAAVLLTITAGLVVAIYQHNEVRKQRDLAHDSAEDATKQKKQAEANAKKASDSAKQARDNADLARKEAARAKVQEEAALKAESEAKAALEKEEAAKKEAIESAKTALAAKKDAVTSQEIAEYEAYVALIGLAAARIEENAFGYALQLLNQCPPRLRNWEWGRLKYLCEQSVRDVNAGSQVESISISRDGSRFATGGWNGLVQVFNTADGQSISSISQPGRYVYSVALSPVTNELATGGSDPRGYVCIWNSDTGELLRKLEGHRDGVLCVVYSRDGNRLLTSSFDNTARLWDARSGQLLKTFVGHTWWVWSAAFSPDEKQIVTASQDGTAIVWSVETGQPSPAFTGHQGPVYSVAFSPNGEQIATGGYDKRVLLWRPNDITPFDFRSAIRGLPAATVPSRALDGHLGVVRCVAFSPDGKQLVSGGHDNTLRVWDVASATLVTQMRGHSGWVRACAFSPDSKRILSGSHDQTARLWDIDGYSEARVLQAKSLRGHRDAVMAVAYSPVANQVVTASRDGTAIAWHAETGRPIVHFEEGHAFLASTAVLYPDGKSLATAAVDNSVRIWDVAHGNQMHELRNTGHAAALTISPDGQLLLTGGLQSAKGWTAQIWDSETGNRIRTLVGHAAEVTAVAFSADGRFCVTGDFKGRAILWQTSTGKELARLDWHTSKITAAVFLGDGQRLLTASDDTTVAQWDVHRLEEDPDSVAPLEQLTLKHDESVISLDVDANKRIAVTCTSQGAARIWNIDRGEEIGTLGVGEIGINSVDISTDGRFVVTSHPDSKTVRLWDLSSAREIVAPAPSDQPARPYLDSDSMRGTLWSATFSPTGDRIVTIGGNEARLWDWHIDRRPVRELMSFSPHAAVVAVSYSPDGRQIVTGSWDGSARIWDVASGRAERKLASAHQGYIHHVTFAPTEPLILTCGDDRTAKLWNAQTGQLVRTLEGHEGAVRFGAFSHDGARALTASDDKLVRIWDVHSGQILKSLESHESGVRCAAFSSDGNWLATGSADTSARLWDLATGRVSHTLSGHTAPVTSVAFTPDGKRIVTASQDFTAKVWDAEKGKEIMNLKGHTQELTSVVFSPDGRNLVTGSQDGTAIIWPAADWRDQ